MAAPPKPVSNWTVPGLLSKLTLFRRVDPGTDSLSFRLAGDKPGRTASIFLSPDHPSTIRFDLVDGQSESREWDDGLEQGSVENPGDLALVLRWWLVEPRV